MTSNHHQLYLQSILRLVKTMAVKFEDAAYSINQAIENEYGPGTVDYDNPRTWKYYQNISGRYHTTDTVMKVPSLDVAGVTVEFTQIALANSPVTKKFYDYGSRFYNELVARYPEQETLILGILYAPFNSSIPGDTTFLDSVIAAPCGTILYYEKTLIEVNETNLHEQLQSWSSQYLNRWVNKAYALIDSLYPALYIGQFYLHLVQVILTMRVRACKTPQVHSFYVREYLTSHGMLDKYIRMLTLKQALFLYRNILYIESNAGRRDTLSWLIENIMTERNLPVFEYVGRHDVLGMVKTNFKVDATDEEKITPLSYDPVVIFKRKPINFKTAEKNTGIRTPEQIMLSMNNRPDGNSNEHHYKSDKIVQGFIASASNVIQTKVLESEAEDPGDVCPYSLENIMVNHMLHYVTSDRYKSRVEFTFPGMKKSIFLDMKEALVLCTYFWLLTTGVTPDLIPSIRAIQINAHKKPTLKELKQIVDGRNVSDNMLTELLTLKVGSPVKIGQVPDLTLNELPALNSAESFLEHCQTLHLAAIRQFHVCANGGNVNACAELDFANDQFYKNYTCFLVETPTKFSDWLIEKSLDLDFVTPDKYVQTAYALFLAVAGATEYKTTTLKNVQRAMLEILKTLSSYSIHFISDVEEPEVIRISNAAPWIIDSGCDSREQTYVEASTALILNHEVRSFDLVEIPLLSEEVEIFHDHMVNWSEVLLDGEEMNFFSSTDAMEHFIEAPFGHVLGFNTDAV
jgi:hypothetical protein